MWLEGWGGGGMHKASLGVSRRGLIVLQFAKLHVQCGEGFVNEVNSKHILTQLAFTKALKCGTRTYENYWGCSIGHPIK